MNKPNDLACAVSRQSIIESELENLHAAVLGLNKLSENIFGMLCSAPINKPPECEKSPVPTVSGSIRDIRTIAEEAGVRFEGIANCLEAQLGNLKLEY